MIGINTSFKQKDKNRVISFLTKNNIILHLSNNKLNIQGSISDIQKALDYIDKKVLTTNRN